MSEELIERVIRVEVKADEALARSTNAEELVTDIHDDVREMRKDLKTVTAWMNKGKGGLAAVLALGGAIGGVLMLLAKHFWPFGNG